MKNNNCKPMRNLIGGAVKVDKSYATSKEIEKRFGAAMLPLTYRHKSNTVILIDNNDNPIGHDNGDGTWSGFDIKLLMNE